MTTPDGALPQHSLSPGLHSPATASLYSPQSGSTIPRKRSSDSASARNKQKAKVTRACDFCKAKKSKCSGEQPCETCRIRGLHCQYEAVYSRGKAPTPRRAETVVPDSKAPHYDQRSPIGPTKSHSIDMVMSRLVDLPSIAPRPRVPDHAREVPSRASPGVEVAGQYSDSTSGLSFLHRAWRRISNENLQVLGSHVGSAEETQLLSCAGDKPLRGTGEVHFPTLGRCYELSEAYFDVCIATYRLIHRPTVEHWMRIVSENYQARQPLDNRLGHAKTSTVLIVLAIATFFEEKARAPTDPSPGMEDTVGQQSDELFCEASRLSNLETGNPTVESAQSRLIQVLYLLMSCRFNQAWYTFGHALQIISALGLHRRDDRKRNNGTHKRDYIEEQCRKRTFWVAYILDKYLGVIFGRPRHYHDEDIDQDFPDAVNDKDMTASGPQRMGLDDCHLESLICHAKLAQIFERISREVYSIKSVPVNLRLSASHRLGDELRQWRASLPPLLGAINPSSLIPSFRRQATVLKLSYCHAVMLAHRPFLLNNIARDNEGLKDLAKESLHECISAAQSVLEIIDRMAHESRMFHAFWWAHYICFCTLVIVYVYAIQESSNPATLQERRIILDQAERCLQHLAQATASNSPSRKYSIILQELRAEAKRKTARPLLQHDPHITLPNNMATESNHHPVQGSQTTANHAATQSLDAAAHMWGPLFDSPIDTATPGLNNFLDDWQTTDWLQLDSSAFASFADLGSPPMMWANAPS